MKHLRTKKILLIFLIVFCSLLLLIFLLLNLPLGHRFITSTVNNILEDAGVPVHITSINKILPKSIAVQGVTLMGAESDTIIYAGEIQADFFPLALLKKRILLSKIILNNASINIHRGKTNLNIAEAFSNGKTDSVIEPVNTKKKWEFSIGYAGLSDISIRMNDSASGIRIDQKIGDLKIEMNKMSLPERTVLVRSIELDGAAGTIRISSQTGMKQADTTAVVPWNIGLDRLVLSNFNIGFNNTTGKQKFAVKLEKAEVNVDKIDLQNKLIDLHNISFSRTSVILLTALKTEQTAQVNSPQSGSKVPFPWNLEAGDLNIEDINFKSGNYGDTTLTFGISNLFLDLSEFKLSKSEAGLKIEKAKFSLDNGFTMNAIKGAIESVSGETSVNLSVVSSNSTFNIKSKAKGDLLSILSGPSEIKTAELAITDTELSLKDLFYFKPGLAEDPLLAALDKTPFIIIAKAKLRDSVLSIGEIKFEKDKSLRIALDGTIRNLFIREKTNGELNLAVPDIDVAWMRSIIKAAGLKIEIPEINSMSITAAVSGSLESSEFTAGIAGDLGNTDISGTFSYNNDVFNAQSVFKEIPLGIILRDTTSGNFNGKVEAKGNGIIHKALVADIKLTIDSVGFKNYSYTRTSLECKIDRQKYDISLKIDDPAIKCDLETTVINSGQVLSIKSEGSFFTQLNKLKLFKDTLAIEGRIKADFQKDNQKVISSLTVSDLRLKTPSDHSTISETSLSFTSDSLRTMLDAAGDFFEINAEIRKPFSELSQLLPDYKRYAASFIDSSSQNRLNRISYLPEMEVTAKISFDNTPGIIMKDKNFYFDNFEIKLINDLEKLNYAIHGKNLKFQSTRIGDINMSLTDSAGRMNMIASAENCFLLDHQFDKIRISNKFFNQQGITDISIFETRDKILYDFEISSVLDRTQINFTIPTRQLILNGVKWQLESPDLLTYKRSDGSVIAGLRMSTGDSYIYVESDTLGGLRTTCEMKQVNIASLLPVALITGNPTGIISGSFGYFKGSKQEKEISTDLIISDISWSGIELRGMSFKASYKSEKENDFYVDMAARMDSSEIILKASMPAEGKRNINAVLTNLSIKNFQPFVKGFLSDLRGQLSGNIEIVMTDKIESFIGELDINKANVRINTLNSVFKIPSDKIVFTGKKIVFDSFSVLDSLDNELVVDGSININKPGEIISDLEILSKNLQVMGSTEEENPTFFGNIYVDSRLSFKGPLTSPDLSGNIVLAGGTEIFFREKENLNLTETEKVLTFVSPVVEDQDAKAEKSISTRASIDAVVRIDPETKIHFELSKRLFNIDLMIQGGGELNYSMLANRDITLAGTYEIADGTTDVKITGWPNKAFTITKGGYIRWDGKLSDPELNFQAVNKVHSSYTNPVDNKQRETDFNVTLKLANRLSALELVFVINTPDQYLMSIINTLSPEEQMRQAITILLFAKIDLPGISTSSNYMTEQVNQLVASQLNQLTKTTISGIDISFGVDSYVQATESGGQETKTSLSYELKKELLNNRAQIEVSGRLNDVNKQPGASDMSLNNVSFEYRLDSAGVKFLKVYNEHTYEDVFEGEVIKTGVGLTYRKNYPTLKDIWRKKNKKTNK